MRLSRRNKLPPLLKPWRMPAMCETCPFATSGKGLVLRKTLRRAFWMETKQTLRDGGFFICHKTSGETGDGSNLVCAGSIEWQARQGVVSNYAQVRERIEAMIKEKEEKS